MAARFPVARCHSLWGRCLVAQQPADPLRTLMCLTAVSDTELDQTETHPWGFYPRTGDRRYKQEGGRKREKERRNSGNSESGEVAFGRGDHRST